MNPALVLGYDTEYFGRKAKTEDQAKEQREHCVCSVKSIVKLHQELKAPCTFFIVGKLIELEPRIVAVLRNTGFDIQSHMYSHTLVKKVPYRQDATLTLDEFGQELVKTNDLIRKHFNKDCIGVRLPYRYQDGLKNNAKHLKVLKDNNISFISADAPFEEQRNVNALRNNPLQPYFYANGILEIPLNGLFDTTFFLKKFDTDYTLEKMRELYLCELEFCANNCMVYTPAFHPWAVSFLDPELSILRALIRRAQKIRIPVLDYTSCFKIFSAQNI